MGSCVLLDVKSGTIGGRLAHALALVEIEKEDWARKMQRLLCRACHVANLARESGVALKPRLVERLERCYDAVLVEGLAFHTCGLVGSDCAAREVPRTNLFLPPSLRTCGGSQRWSPDRHPLRFCASRSVGVA
jgi:hypothetical protein